MPSSPITRCVGGFLLVDDPRAPASPSATVPRSIEPEGHPEFSGGPLVDLVRAGLLKAASVREMLAQGSSANERDERGLSVLHWAVRWGWCEGVLILLEAGADPDALSANGWSVRDFARKTDSALSPPVFSSGSCGNREFVEERFDPNEKEMRRLREQALECVRAHAAAKALDRRTEPGRTSVRSRFRM